MNLEWDKYISCKICRALRSTVVALFYIVSPCGAPIIRASSTNDEMREPAYRLPVRLYYTASRNPFEESEKKCLEHVRITFGT